MNNSFLLVACITLFANIAAAQNRFYYKHYDLNDAENRVFIQRNADNLGSILIDAYLKGKIKGYAFDYKEEVLKYADLPEDEKPNAWKADVTYYFGDLVAYQDKFYSTEIDYLLNDIPPDRSPFWFEYELNGDILSRRYSFPLLADTLSKKDFLQRMTIEDFLFAEPWQPDTYYYHGDLVNYRGNIFEAMWDNHDEIPGYGENWVGKSSSFGFKGKFDISGFRILFTEVNGREVPQLISPLFFDHTYYLNIAFIHFYADEVLQYLQNNPGSLLYQSTQAFIADNTYYFADDQAQIATLKSMQENIINKKLKLNKKKTSSIAVKLFSNASAEEFDQMLWTIFQDMRTQELVISYRKFFAGLDPIGAYPVLSIPAKSWQKVMKHKPLALYTYADALNDTGKFFPKFEHEELTIDSVEIPLKKLPAANKKVQYISWLESQRVSFITSSDDIYNEFAALWNWIYQQSQQGVIKNNTAFYTPFNWEFNWSGTQLKFRYDKLIELDSNFSLLGITEERKLPEKHEGAKLEYLAIEYKREVHLNGRQSITPLSVQIGLAVPFSAEGDSEEEGSVDQLYYYTFTWPDLLAANSAEAPAIYKHFLNQVKAAELKFTSADAVYGLIGN
ncbi:MAG TPA: hypothetical protein PKC24_10700 [Cyclobacteriaceae bacterium]|nr:hypothetical protein [Cyclobacteriaceae bacterium]